MNRTTAQPHNLAFKFLRFLSVMFLFLIIGCQKEEIQSNDGLSLEQANNTFFKVKTVSQEELWDDFPAFFGKTQNEKGNGSSDGYVLADLGRLIQTEIAQYYTFAVLNTSGEYLENVVFCDMDSLREVYLVQYDFNKQELEQLKNSEPFSILWEEKVVNVSELSENEYPSTDRSPCNFVFEESTSCSYGNHEGGYLSNGAECPGHSTDVTMHVDCGGGGSGPGSGDGPGGNSGGGGGGDNDPSDTEYSANEFMLGPGVTTVPTPPSSYDIFISWFLSPAQMDYLESHPAEQAAVKEFLGSNGYSTFNMAFAEEAIGVLENHPELTFNHLLYNKNPYTDANTTGDANNNPVGGYDVYQYPDFNPTQQQWPTISNVIPVSEFIGWGHVGIDRNCMDYAKAQIAVKGYQISNYFNNNGQTIQIYTAQDGADAQAVEDAISYLIYALENGIPVIVGVDAHSGSPNPQTDNTTDHFVVVVGMGSDSNGEYFTFFDNASSLEPYSSYGASTSNKLYYNSSTKKIIGTAQTPYCQDSEYGSYTVTHIRKSKSL